MSFSGFKRLMVCATVVVTLSCAAPSVSLAANSSSPGLSVPSAVLVTAGGSELWARNCTSQRRVASTIKMLNALVVRERASLDETVTVSAKAARTEDGVGLVKGQKLTVRKLLQMMLIASANDAAEALAIHIAGSEKKYVALMNAKAAKMGLKGTHAVDPHGLSKREKSTAHDLSVLGREVLEDPVLSKIVLMRSVVLYRPHMKPKTLRSTDRLLGHYRGIKGIKTGFTYAAGYCFVSAAKRGDVELVGVVLGAGSPEARFAQTRKLLDWGFAHHRVRRVVSTDTTMGVVQVSNGTTSSVSVHAARNVSRVIFTGAPVTTQVVLPSPVLAPIKRGDQLGVVKVSQRGKALVSVALLADSAVASITVVPTSSVDPSGSAAGGAAEGTVWERLAGLPRRVLVALASTL